MTPRRRVRRFGRIWSRARVGDEYAVRCSIGAGYIRAG